MASPPGRPRARAPRGRSPRKGGVKGFPRDALSFRTARPTGKLWGRLAPRPRRPGRLQSPPQGPEAPSRPAAATGPPTRARTPPAPRGPLYSTLRYGYGYGYGGAPAQAPRAASETGPYRLSGVGWALIVPAIVPVSQSCWGGTIVIWGGPCEGHFP